MTKAWLESQFGAGDAPGWSEIRQNEDEEQVFSRTGGPVGLCWGAADEVVAELGSDRAVRSGYFCSINSNAIIAKHAEGHDFAIVDGRFLVDGWLAHVAAIGPCVLDLLDAQDYKLALRIHEPMALWTQQPYTLSEKIAA